MLITFFVNKAAGRVCGHIYIVAHSVSPPKNEMASRLMSAVSKARVLSNGTSGTKNIIPKRNAAIGPDSFHPDHDRFWHGMSLFCFTLLTVPYSSISSNI